MKTKKLTGVVARVLVALVFVASAVTKYISIDAFDQFVYEHQIFSWITTTIVTRLLIAAEFSLGLFLLLNLKPKVVKILTIAFLVFFSGYILLKPYMFDVDQENCHCFGTVLILSDQQTLIKNILLLFLSFFMFWDKGEKLETPGCPNFVKKAGLWIRDHQTYMCLSSLIFVLVLSFGINMPDSLRYKLYGKAAKIDEEKFESLIRDPHLENLQILEGKKIVCMYSPACKFCKKAAKRLDVMRQKYNIKDDCFALIFWGGDKAAERFFVKTDTKQLPFVNVPAKIFLEATRGKQPVIILMNNGKIVKLLKYPNIIDNDIADFINN